MVLVGSLNPPPSKIYFCSIFLRAGLVSIKFTDFSWGLTSFVFLLIRNVFLFFRLRLVQGLV